MKCEVYPIHFLLLAGFFFIALEVIANDEHKVNQLLEQAEALQYVQKDSALYMVGQARAISENLRNPGLLARVNNREGAIYYIAGEYNLSLERFSNATMLARKSGNLTEEVNALNGRGLINLTDQEYTEALRLFEECIQINLTLGDSVSVSKNYFNIGMVHSELEHHHESLENLNLALDFLQNYPEHLFNLTVKSRLGFVHTALGQFETANAIFVEVLQAGDPLTHWERSFALTGLAALKHQRGHHLEALELGLEAYKIAKQHGAHWDLEQVTQILGEVYEATGDFENSLAFTKLSRAYHDSLYDKNKNRQIARLQLKLSQTDNDRLRAEGEIDQHLIQKHNRLLFLLGIVLLSLLVLVYFFRKNLLLKESYNGLLAKKNLAIEAQKRRILSQNQSLKEINTTKTKLISILSHDLRSPINSIKQLLEMKKQGFFTKEEEAEAVGILIDQVEKTEDLMNNLLKWANSQMDGMEVNPVSLHLPEVVEEILSTHSFQVKAKNIQIHHKRLDLPLVEVDKNHFQIIIQNLIGNAIKFTPFHGEIGVFYHFDDKQVHLHIKDSGTGIDQDTQAVITGDGSSGRVTSMIGTANEKGTGLGLLLVKQFIAFNDAEINVDSVNGIGTEFTISFKRVAFFQ